MGGGGGEEGEGQPHGVEEDLGCCRPSAIVLQSTKADIAITCSSECYKYRVNIYTFPRTRLRPDNWGTITRQRQVI